MESRREYYRRLTLFAIDQLENLKNAFPDKVAQFYVDNNGVHAYIDYEMFNENFPVDKEEKIFDDIVVSCKVRDNVEIYAIRRKDDW